MSSEGGKSSTLEKAGGYRSSGPPLVQSANRTLVKTRATISSHCTDGGGQIQHQGSQHRNSWELCRGITPKPEKGAQEWSWTRILRGPVSPRGLRMEGPDPGIARDRSPLRARTEGPDPGIARDARPCGPERWGRTPVLRGPFRPCGPEGIGPVGPIYYYRYVYNIIIIILICQH